MRMEKDFIGTLEVPKDALYGIHSLRAKINFPNIQVFNLNWYKAVGLTKKAVYLSYKKFKEQAEQKYNLSNFYFNKIDNKKIEALIEAATEVSEGKYFDNFIVPAISGGAGTSINMNINEIVSNVALKKLSKSIGEYDFIDPINEANIFQSTNDVIPTSLRIATIKLLKILEDKINNSRKEIEDKERFYSDVLRLAYTQMQEAVPCTYGRLFSNYQEMLSRDWWRVSKCFERIKVINLGGSAIGTGLTVPKFMIFEMAETLKQISNLPVCRGENLTDTTSNLDSFVEVHAVLKAHAVNLEKLSSDLRLLASDLSPRTIKLPAVQLGSTIMPSKINPVISEYIISCSHKIYANDLIISSLSAQGVLDLNAYLPIIGDALLNSIELLISCNETLTDNMLKNIVIDKDKSTANVFNSPSIATALIPYIGYKEANKVAEYMKISCVDIFEAAKKLKILSKEKLELIFAPSELIKQGYTLADI